MTKIQLRPPTSSLSPTKDENEKVQMLMTDFGDKIDDESSVCNLFDFDLEEKPEKKVLLQKLPQYVSLIDAYSEKAGIWREAAIVKEDKNVVTVHILFKNSECNYEIEKKDGKLPPYLAPYGSKTFIGTNYEVIKAGFFIDVKLNDNWAVRKVREVNLPEKRLKIVSSKCKTWLPFSPNCFLPLHHKTKSFHLDHTYRIKYLNTHPELEVQEPSILRRSSRRRVKPEKLSTYREKLRKLGFELAFMVGDGNCLFRAISHQVYGTPQQHVLVRNNCIDYLQINKERFTPFVASNENDFDTYLKEKRKTGVWGDHVELQALCEIYKRPLYIFSETQNGKVTVLQALNENLSATNSPFILSFLNEHYNSLIFLKDRDAEHIAQISLTDFLIVSQIRKTIKNSSKRKLPKVGVLEEQSKDKLNLSKRLKPAVKEPIGIEDIDKDDELERAIKLSKQEYKNNNQQKSQSSTSNSLLLQNKIVTHDLSQASDYEMDKDLQLALEQSLKER